MTKCMSQLELSQSELKFVDAECIQAVETSNLELLDVCTRKRGIDRPICYQDLRSPVLYLASSLGRNEVVERLIQSSADVNLQADDGTLPLYVAAKNGHHRVVRMLIQGFADVDARSCSSGATPLYIASKMGHKKVVGLLIDAAADVNIQNMHGASPLYISVQESQVEVINMLIMARADVNLQIKSGEGPLHYASQCNLHTLVGMLLRAHVDVNIQQSEGASPLIIASQLGHYQMAERLLEAGADANLYIHMCFVPLHLAAQNGHLRIVKMLIRAQADIDHQGRHGYAPIHFAAQNGHNLVVKALLDEQANVNVGTKDGATPLYIAAAMGHGTVVQQLVAAQADPDTKRLSSDSPLYIAAQRNHKTVVGALTSAQADVNAQVEIGTTPLYIAAQEGHQRVVETLLNSQADANLTNVYGVSPMFVAAQNGHQQVVKMLVGAHADVNGQNNIGEVPLHAASGFGHHRIVETLASALADVNVQNLHGCTSIYMAAQNGHSKAVDALIAAQTDADIQPAACSPPLYASFSKGHYDIAEKLIRKARVDVDQQIGYTGESALHLTARLGCCQSVAILLNAQADTNLLTSSDWSPLYAACQDGQDKVAEMLIRTMADVDQRTSSSASPLSIAIEQGHDRVAQILMKAEAMKEMQLEEVDVLESSAANGGSDGDESTKQYFADSDISQRLHLALTRAGFVQSRAALQSAVADVLQAIMRHRAIQLSHHYIFVVGSYSEGWGNSLVCADGKTDIESDIDVMHLFVGRRYHLRGYCKCEAPEPESVVGYENGHVVCPGFASSPARASVGSALAQLPAVDEVGACELCCYPPIAPLEQASSNIPGPVLQSLEAELSTSPCHVVHAAPPGQGGEQLRVSTTFLEKRLLRSLNTVQGQLFVTLKYLVKKVICRRVNGVKAYHAKTLVFRLIQETPADQWQPDQLVVLTRRALQMLLDSVKSSARTPDSRIMTHFFLGDAALYLKGSDRSSVTSIANALTETLENLPQLLMQFVDSLRSVDEIGGFKFHPFLILPLMDPRPQPSRSDSSCLKYHEIYDVVAQALLDLASDSCTPESLIHLIGQLPHRAAFSAREALRVMAGLKFGYTDAVQKILRHCGAHKAAKSIAWSANRPEAEATPDFVWQHLNSCDSAWKFCLRFDRRLELGGCLPQFLASVFPTRLQPVSVTCYYLNFDALLKCLRLEFGVATQDSAAAWFEDVVQRDSGDADLQELLMTLHYCRNSDQIARLLLRHGDTVSDAAASGFPEACRYLDLLQQLKEVAQMIDSGYLTIPLD